MKRCFTQREPHLKMPNVSEVIDISGYPLIPLEKESGGLYPFPRMRYGILPYYVYPTGQVAWGCIESNRVGPVTLAPAAGTQDVIAIKDEQRLVFELGKPLPDFKVSGLTIGQLFRDQAYQESIECLIENGFKVYLENPLATAIHEAYEEHGIDLDHAKHLLNRSLELSPKVQTLIQKGIASPLCVWFPELISCEGITLRYTEKIDAKMRRNSGRAFYERGCWVTLEEFKAKFVQQKEMFSSLNEYTSVRIELITEAFTAFELHMQLLESIESSIQAGLYEIQPQNMENPDINILIPPQLSEISLTTELMYENPNIFFKQGMAPVKQQLRQNLSESITSHL